MGDFLEHKMHVHEPPVSKELPSIIDTTEDLIVINKPAGMPVSFHFLSLFLAFFLFFSFFPSFFL